VGISQRLEFAILAAKGFEIDDFGTEGLFGITVR